jgi:nucleotidyltransferase substrate binding protein (TIGR01987 family)
MIMIKKEAQISQFEKTIKNLREVLIKIDNISDDREVFKDSAIQRFEISFDVCWKTLKEFLRLDFGVNESSPKKVFQASFKEGIIDNDVIWLEMTDIRNETSHAYNEGFAELVLGKLPEICDTLEKLLWKLKK